MSNPMYPTKYFVELVDTVRKHRRWRWRFVTSDWDPKKLKWVDNIRFAVTNTFETREDAEKDFYTYAAQSWKECAGEVRVVPFVKLSWRERLRRWFKGLRG